MTATIPLFQIYWDQQDVSSVVSSIKSGMNWAIGENVGEFESKIAEYLGVNFCTVFNSGTSALHTLLLACGIGTGDEVIVPSFTFVATANAPLFVGAKPVFADIETETFGLDPEEVKEKITRRTKAILPIHYAGCPCKIKELREIADDNNLILIEDAAESLGAKIDGELAGTFGEAAILSFCQNKIITTGEGGALITNSREIDERAKLIRSHGQAESSSYFMSPGIADYLTLGYNFRMSNITAALGLSQLSKIDQIIKMRRANASYLTAGLKRIGRQVLPFNPAHGRFHVYQMYIVLSDRRDELMQHLYRNGIMTKVYFGPVHLTYLYSRLLKDRSELPITEQISNQVLALPMYPALRKDEMNVIVEEVKKFTEGQCTT